MICGRPLHRVSYCADDHSEKKIFAFIAKDQETKKHNCFVFICEKLVSVCFPFPTIQVFIDFLDFRYITR